MNNKSANLNRELLSVVVPCHNEEASLPLLFDAIDSVAQQLTAAHPNICIELVIVDDGSRDKQSLLLKTVQRSIRRYTRNGYHSRATLEKKPRSSPDWSTPVVTMSPSSTQISRIHLNFSCK